MKVGPLANGKIYSVRMRNPEKRWVPLEDAAAVNEKETYYGLINARDTGLTSTELGQLIITMDANFK